jgi:hypothetical protein
MAKKYGKNLTFGNKTEQFGNNLGIIGNDF